MAKIIDNIVMEGVSGKLGDKLVFRVSKGRTIVTTKPSYSDGRSFSEAQLAQQAAFSEAITYAQGAKDQEAYRIKANGSGKSPYNVAVADWFNAPEVIGVDLSGWNGGAGELIRVQARDDVQVKHVIVKISDGNGELLEEGRATESEKHWFAYTTVGSYTGALTVTATAMDLPGNTTELSREKTIS